MLAPLTAGPPGESREFAAPDGVTGRALSVSADSESDGRAKLGSWA